MSRTLLRIRLRFEHDVVIARQRAREAARLLGLRTGEQTRVATAVSELARRAYRGGTQGEITFLLTDEGPGGQRLVIRIAHARSADPDTLRDLDDVLTATRRLMDHVRVGGSDDTVRIEIGHDLPGGDAALSEDDVDAVVDALRRQSPNNPFEEIQQQNEELVKAMEALREQERERTRLLEAERQAREAAQVAVEDREEILSIVSHDLRNPLGAIQTSSRFLLENPGLASEETGQRQLQAIQRSARRATRLIQDLLDLSSIERGQLSIEREPVDPRELVSEAAELFSGVAEEKDVRLEDRIEDDLPPVQADRDRVVQVLGNLISNAVRFAPPGGWVRVGARGDVDGVRFEVGDSGPGVPEEVRDQLFERYWKGEGSNGGTGLGLYIVRGIVESHGGSIWLEREAGDVPGALFRFTLPASEGDGSSTS